MGYLKITQYLYLVAAGIFAFDAITHWNDEPKPWISVGIALVSLFLFFFRRHFAKKFQDRQNAQGRK
ncbi:hypothetical protein SAMN05444377_102215 [Flavobacterium fontis]|jgi:hypothetical protein|uniref:Uncharacterized protein n=1 Tax=Flavobacterium fontis TaxID=1124188 RepID=A0A1M4XXJ5_9FLAO|nr:MULTISPECIES: hypothetical protein [Flavobacterium]MCZ8169154.1 hypothetical protein [Flavobacterium sp.]MCZ8298122.1 hypothetical protein [Flavobacterium sp.]SHE98076.1 hypothetical protein SAMN05444377_102215 [Flavobacterium fontis]